MYQPGKIRVNRSPRPGSTRGLRPFSRGLGRLLVIITRSVRLVIRRDQPGCRLPSAPPTPPRWCRLRPRVGRLTGGNRLSQVGRHERGGRGCPGRRARRDVPLPAGRVRAAGRFLALGRRGQLLVTGSRHVPRPHRCRQSDPHFPSLVQNFSACQPRVPVGLLSG